MGRMKQSQITYWCHEIIRSQAEEGGYYIDATMGKGNDTLFLCELAGEKGKVLAFDIQQEALDVTKELLKTHGKEMQAELILENTKLPKCFGRIHGVKKSGLKKLSSCSRSRCTDLG